MIVTCEHCQARYKLDDAKIKGRGAKITCPKCKHAFVVLLQSGHETTLPSSPLPEPPGVSDLPPPSPPAYATGPDPLPEPARPAKTKRLAEDLNFKTVGITTWKVKVKIGLVYDFSDIRTLRKYIQDKRVTEDDVISFNGNDWVRLGDIPDLDSFFVRIYEEQESRLKGDAAEKALGGEIFEDGPTMIVGMGSLGANISTGVFSKPQTGSSSESAPAPVRDITSGNSKPTNTFADPFDALKARQREKMQARRENQAPGGAQIPAKERKSPLQRALPIVGGLAALMVLAMASTWYLKQNSSSGQTETSPEIVVPTGANQALADEEYRQRMRERLETELKQVEATPLNTTAESESDDGALRPRIPEGMNPDPGARGTSSRGTTTTSSGGMTQTPSTAADHAMAGDDMARSGDWAGAAAAYAKASQLDSNNANLHYKLGESLYYSKSYADAERELKIAAGRGVRNAHKILGHLLRDQGDNPGAVMHYQEYLKGNPGDKKAIEAEISKLNGG